MLGISKSKKMSLEEVTQIMSEIALPLSLYLMPSNYDKEREKFLETTTYNPSFKYRKANKNKGLFEKLENLEEVEGVDPEISAYIIKVIKDKEQAAQLLEQIGNDAEFLRISEERFGRPTHKLFKRACKFLRRKYGDIAIAERDEELKKRILKYDDLVPIFEVVFEKLGLEGWTLDKSKAIIASGFRTAIKSKRIMVDPNVEVSAEKLRKTIIHEVATHALRGHNGFATGYEVFGKPNLNEYLDEEEGLAMYNEEKFGVLRDIDVRKRAGLVYAMYIGQNASFRQTYDAISAAFPKNTAFETVFRVKRGMSDTSKPGCYTRDATYLRGYLKVRKKLADDKVTYRYMYAGKLPSKYLYLVEEGILPKPKVVPTQELMDEIFKKAGLVGKA